MKGKAVRLDARIKTGLSAFVSPHKGGTERVANVVDLSLSGLLLDGLANRTPGTFRLRLPLQKNNSISLDGDIIRINGSQSAMRLYVPERETTAKLWQFIRDKIAVQDTCPYCDNLIKSDLDYCQRCGWYLNFNDANYLDKHLDETMLLRIMGRLKNFSVGQRHHVLNLIDREFLAIKGITNIAPLRDTRASLEKQTLMEVLEMTSHNKAKAAALLGVSRPTIYDLMKKHGISSSNA